ncbi:unnamed protein product [Lathyrus sativus]|nr:unnamed protein product [Lathyrus sativus]
MGIGYSSCNTNLGINCPDFCSSTTGTTARWGPIEVSMCADEEEEDHTKIWGVSYYIGKKSRHGFHDHKDIWGMPFELNKGSKQGCGFQLRAKHDDNGVENIYFALSANDDSTDGFNLDIKRVGNDGLQKQINGMNNSGIYKTSICVKQGYSIESTIVSFGNSYSDTLFVLQMKKRKNHDNAYMATMAHYYVTKEVGLSVAAKIYLCKGKGFAVEVKGPFKDPSDDLRRVIAETCRTGIWSPEAKSSSSFKNNDTAGQFVNHASSSNKGLINSNGYTRGSLNNSIFKNCRFS